MFSICLIEFILSLFFSNISRFILMKQKFCITLSNLYRKGFKLINQIYNRYYYSFVLYLKITLDWSTTTSECCYYSSILRTNLKTCKILLNLLMPTFNLKNMLLKFSLTFISRKSKVNYFVWMHLTQKPKLIQFCPQIST